MISRTLLALVIALAVVAASSNDAAYARRKSTPKVPARIHFSGNIEGELEPCG